MLLKDGAYWFLLAHKDTNNTAQILKLQAFELYGGFLKKFESKVEKFTLTIHLLLFICHYSLVTVYPLLFTCYYS